MQLVILALVTALLYSGVAEASDQSEPKGVRGFVGIYGGVAFPDSLSNFTQPSGSATVHLTDLKLQTGPMVGMKLGLWGSERDTMSRWFGVELDGSYTQTKIKEQPATISVGSFRLSGLIDETRVKLMTGAVHLLVRFPQGPIQPYVGAGPAIVYARVSDSYSFNAGNSTTLGLSAVGGVRVVFTDNFGAFLEYKHIRSELEFDPGTADLVVHAGVGGLNIMF